MEDLGNQAVGDLVFGGLASGFNINGRSSKCLLVVGITILGKRIDGRLKELEGIRRRIGDIDG